MKFRNFICIFYSRFLPSTNSKKHSTFHFTSPPFFYVFSFYSALKLSPSFVLHDLSLFHSSSCKHPTCNSFLPKGPQCNSILHKTSHITRDKAPLHAFPLPVYTNFLSCSTRLPSIPHSRRGTLLHACRKGMLYFYPIFPVKSKTELGTRLPFIFRRPSKGRKEFSFSLPRECDGCVHSVSKVAV